MSKTTAPRVRALNLYTVTADGQPVAQAEAISQAEAVALWVASQQQPTLSARLATPRESRELAHLPLLTRGASPAAPERDPRVPDMFDDVPAAPVLLATYCQPVELPVKTHLPEVLAQIAADLDQDHVEDVREMVPPQHAPIEAMLECLASGEPMALAPPTAAPTVDHAHAEVDAPTESADVPTAWLDDVALTARKSDAFHAGFELGRRGLKRFSAEMLNADVDMLRGIRSGADADVVHTELLRGFDDGKAQAVQVGTQDHRRPLDDAPKGAGKVAAKYRNPATGESWSGRGLRPRWVVLAMDGGRTLEDFLIGDQPGSDHA